MTAEVVVLRLAGEGGGYTILGREDADGAWIFKVDVVDFTPTLIDEPSVERSGDWVPSLDTVLAQINPNWFRLIPRVVHPQFQIALLAEVSQRLLARNAGGGVLNADADENWRRWQKLCGVVVESEED